ncbi:MAG: metallophosphoesterase [Oscillospiraceae bacterium]
MALYAIGDTHLSLSCDKPMDIFGGWDGYVEKLKENWQNVVKQEDTVVIPGDISWGMSLNDSLKDFEFIHKLNGKKLILKGNHDYWWSTKNKMDKFLLENGLTSIKIIHNNSEFAEGVNICGTRGWIFEKGEAFDQKILAREAGRLEASIKDAQKSHPEAPIIVFLHYPPIYCNEISKEILDIIFKYNIKECYYGHIHSVGCKYAINGVANGINLKLVSADFLDFMPYKIK